MTATVELKTDFASAERSPRSEILEQNLSIASNEELKQVLDAMPTMVAILNEHRQIVLANDLLVQSLGNNNLDNVLGTRPGELAKCPHSTKTEAGCGTTEACRNCGAVSAILAAQAGETVTRECLINPPGQVNSFELEVKATPVELQGKLYTIFTVLDISNQNTVKLLERTFFHDIMNAAGGVQGLGMMVDEAEDMEEVQEYAPLLAGQAEQLIAVIQAQRDLMAAERGDLKVATAPVNSGDQIKATVDLYSNHDVAAGKKLAIDTDSWNGELVTSEPLLQRTLGNMVKNALEASGSGETVTLGCHNSENGTCFWVHNPRTIPVEVQQDIFKRSFSTKGEGRGIGTYSMKLMGENYLNGKVGFDSTEADGTTFWIELPS